MEPDLTQLSYLSEYMDYLHFYTPSNLLVRYVDIILRCYAWVFFRTLSWYVVNDGDYIGVYIGYIYSYVLLYTPRIITGYNNGI